MFKFSGVLSKYSKAFTASQIFDKIFSKALVSGVNHSLVLENIDPIQYDFVETYWHKKYGDKRNAKVQPNSRVYDESAS
jgi:hypothetical protein